MRERMFDLLFGITQNIHTPFGERNVKLITIFVYVFWMVVVVLARFDKIKISDKTICI